MCGWSYPSMPPHREKVSAIPPTKNLRVTLTQDELGALKLQRGRGHPCDGFSLLKSPQGIGQGYMGYGASPTAAPHLAQVPTARLAS